VVMDFNGDKAVGPDGFLMAFFYTCWAIIKIDLLDIFQYFLIMLSLRKV